jgi:hypothetical protein
VAPTLFCLTSGGVSLADAERLDEDDWVKALLGLQKCPDQSALGQWLRQAGAAGGVEALRQINREFVAWILAQAPKERYLHSGRLECFFDDTRMDRVVAWLFGAVAAALAPIGNPCGGRLRS